MKLKINGTIIKLEKSKIYKFGYKKSFSNKGAYFFKLEDIIKKGNFLKPTTYLKAMGNIKLFIGFDEYLIEDTYRDYKNGMVANINDIAFIHKFEGDDYDIKINIIKKIKY